MPLADYLRGANADTFVAVQIEHVDAVAEVEKIARLADLDLLFIGPADLAQSMGLPGVWDHPQLWAAIERVAQASRETGVPWAILPANPAYVRRCVDMGCRMLAVGGDGWAFARGVKSFQAEYAEFFSAASV